MTRRSLATAVAVLLPTAVANAQCTPQPLPLSGPMAGIVNDIAVAPNGDVFLLGWLSINAVPGTVGIARYDGSAWHSVGGGLSGSAPWGGFPITTGNTIAFGPGGNVYVSGNFSMAGAVPASGLARWNGASWSAMGGSPDNGISSIAVLPNGDVVVTGAFTQIGGVPLQRIARWDGSAWSAMGSGLTGGGQFNSGQALLVDANGDLIVAGQFTDAGGVPAPGIARWSGGIWSAIGSLSVTPTIDVELALLPDGDVVVSWVPLFTLTRQLARWDGATWTAIPDNGCTSGSSSIAVLPTGELVGCGPLGIDRWDGQSWSPLAANGFEPVALAATADGEIWIGGDFAPHVELWASTCPASVNEYGSGCPGAGGTNELTASTGPWIASTWRANTTGLLPGSLAVGVYGTGQLSVPLNVATPLALGGCDLLVGSEFLLQLLVTGSSVATSIEIPTAASLVGVAFHHQVIAAETFAGNVIALTSSNALALTIGSF